MVDREKVIKGLEAHCNDRVCKANNSEYCPYFHENKCSPILSRDALELLKKQEPHVLTLEEAEKAEYCVLEVRNGSLLQVLHDESGGYFSPSLNNSENLYYERLFDEDKHDDYNKRVRCWSALPTEEQREAVKWE